VERATRRKLPTAATDHPQTEPLQERLRLNHDNVPNGSSVRPQALVLRPDNSRKQIEPLPFAHARDAADNFQRGLMPAQERRVGSKL
jgi:hypothetical protein